MARSATILLVIALAAQSSYALDPRQAVTQYAHTAWAERDGTIKAGSLQIAQTSDGFIWLGGEAGVVRFDGVRFLPLTRPGGHSIGNVQCLLASADGSLWFGTMTSGSTNGGGLFRWRDGDIVDYGARHPELAGRASTLFGDRTGEIWVGYYSGRLCRISKTDAVDCRDMPHRNDSRLRDRPLAMLEDRAGTLWVGGEHLYRWSGDRLDEIERRGGAPPRVTIVAMVEDNGRVLLATPDGLEQLDDGIVRPYPVPAMNGPSPSIYDVLRDRDGALWIATTNRGLIHLGQNGIDTFSRRDGLPSDIAERFLEDREGNVWVTTEGGLSRFRETSVVTLSTREGLPTNSAYSLAVDGGDDVWVAEEEGDLARVRRGRVAWFRAGIDLPKGGAGQLAVDAAGRVWTMGQQLFYMDGEHAVAVRVLGPPLRVFSALTVRNVNDVWAQTDSQTIVHLHVDDHQVARPISTQAFPGKSVAALVSNAAGTVWVGFFEGGVARWSEGEWTEMDTRHGLTSGQTRSLSVDGAGVWVAGADGVSRVEQGRMATMSVANGLPCGVLRDMVRDGDGALWIASQCGLLRIAKTDLDTWWAGLSASVHPRLFDHLDGFPARATYAFVNQRSARTSDGRLWFLLDGPGVAVIDPRHLPDNHVFPPVIVESLAAEGVIVPGPAPTLPALTRDTRIDYTALSYTMPERVRFRYRLDGFDTTWHEVLNVRQATYTNLPPRHYRFQVVAANNSGLWSTTPATFAFSIRPAFYQTRSFAALMAGCAGLLGWGLHRQRVRYRLHQMKRLFDERLDERTRVARELHDTLIQDLTAVSLCAELADDQLPAEPVPAKATLTNLRRDLARVIAYSRTVMATLRFVSPSERPLADALSRLVTDLPRPDSSRPRIELIVEGNEYPLPVEAHDEFYLIAREALTNALRHAAATHIVVELSYEPNVFRLRVQDDGQGIDRSVMAKGPSGHFGMQGMRERAARMNATLKVFSRRGAGTEVLLTFPAVASMPDAESL